MNDRTPIHRSQSALGNFEPVRRVTETHRRRAGSSPPPSPTPLDQGATVSEYISQRDEGQRIIKTYLKTSSSPVKQQQQSFQLSPHLSITSSQRSLNNQSTSQPVAIRPQQRPVTDGY